MVVARVVHGQTNSGRATRETMHPSCVQTPLNAVNASGPVRISSTSRTIPTRTTWVRALLQTSARADPGPTSTAKPSGDGTAGTMGRGSTVLDTGGGAGPAGGAGSDPDGVVGGGA